MSRENQTTFIRVKKDKNYSTIHNGFLRRKDLSWKAKGIMAYILQLPDDWNVVLSEVVKNATEGQSAFDSGWKELKDAGYVKRQPVKHEKTNKILYWETIVTESVSEKSHSVENHSVENHRQDNHKLLSTKELSTNKLNTNKGHSPAKAEQNIPYKEIIEYLNEKTDRDFKHTTKNTRSLIRARFNNGFTLEDFKVAIDNKVKSWLNDKEYNKYLRPETLFGTKFEGYLNERPYKKKENKKAATHEELMKQIYGQEAGDGGDRTRA